MVYKNNPKTTGNCLCLENFVLYKIYKKIEFTKDTLYITLVISKSSVQNCVETEGGDV